MNSALWKRQGIAAYDNSEADWSWQTALIVKWAIIGGISAVLFLWFTVGYWHARRRMKSGKRLLGYHRFMIPYSRRRQFEPELQNQFSFYRVQESPYGEDTAQPPGYDSSYIPPPTYQPPEGSSKTNPVQTYVLPSVGADAQSLPKGHPEEAVASPAATARRN